MLGHRTGERVKEGNYWSLSTGEFVSISKGGGVLPGSGGERYLRVPVGLVMVLGPFVGLGFVIFLPLIGFLMLAFFLGQKAGRPLRRAGRALIQVAVPSWVPGVSYLTKRGLEEGAAQPRKKEPEALEAESLLRDLEREIAEKRRKEES